MELRANTGRLGQIVCGQRTGHEIMSVNCLHVQQQGVYQAALLSVTKLCLLCLCCELSLMAVHASAREPLSIGTSHQTRLFFFLGNFILPISLPKEVTQRSKDCETGECSPNGNPRYCATGKGFFLGGMGNRWHLSIYRFSKAVVRLMKLLYWPCSAYLQDPAISWWVLVVRSG